MRDKLESQLLIVDFDCKPEDITRVLGLKPTQVVLKGEVKSKDPSGVGPAILHKNNVWVLQFDVPTNIGFDDHLELVLKQLMTRAEAIAEVAGKYRGELSVFGFVRDADRIALNLPRERISELAKLNIDFDVDIYPIVD